MLCGCVGVNGGGLNHYVGQEKLAPVESWCVDRVRARLVPAAAPAERADLALRPHATSGATSASSPTTTPCPPTARRARAAATPIDLQVAGGAQRAGCRSIRSSTENPLDVVARGRAGRREDRRGRSSTHVVERLEVKRAEVRGRGSRRAGELAARLVHLARQRAAWPSAKGHEYFLKHYLGTHDNAIAEEVRRRTRSRTSRGTSRRRAGRWTSSST